MKKIDPSTLEPILGTVRGGFLTIGISKIANM